MKVVSHEGYTYFYKDILVTQEMYDLNIWVVRHHNHVVYDTLGIHNSILGFTFFPQKTSRFIPTLVSSKFLGALHNECGPAISFIHDKNYATYALNGLYYLTKDEWFDALTTEQKENYMWQLHG